MQGLHGSSPETSAALGEWLAAVLADILHLDAATIDHDASFRELGASSVEGVQWLQSIGSRYGLRLSTSRLDDHPTLRAFASYLRSELDARAASVIVDGAAAECGSRVTGGGRGGRSRAMSGRRRMRQLR